MSPDTFFSKVHGGLIVSCQALEHEPLHSAEIMARMALAAVEAGAVGIRCNSPADTAAIRAAVDLPIIGIYKDGDTDVFITPSVQHVIDIAEAGADMVALDATRRRNDLAACVTAAHERSTLVMADISTFEEGLAAAVLGVDCVSTTLSGYTDYSQQQSEPDLELVRRLSEVLEIPVIAEGRYNTPLLARDALDAGAHAVVVGSAITRPQLIAAEFVRALNNRPKAN